MVEKRVFDTLIAGYMRKESAIRIVALVDNEGLPISFVIKSRKYKIKPNTLGSLIKQAIYPLDNYNRNLNLEHSLLQLYILEDGTLIVFNMGVGVLGILLDNSGWPLDHNLLRELIEQLRLQLEKLVQTESSLLSSITGDSKQDALETFSSDKISSIIDVIDSFSKGKMNPLLTMEATTPEETFMKIGETFDSFIIDEKKTILSMNPNYGPEFVSSTSEYLDIINSFDKFKSGKVLCGLSYYSNKNCIFTGILGAYNGNNIFMVKKFPDWSIGFKSIISECYSIANYLVADFASDESMNLIETIIYLTESINGLKDRAETYLEDEDYDIAYKFIERAAILSIHNGDYDTAGDFFKWKGYLHHQQNDNKNTVKEYEKAASAHISAGNFEKAGDDYKDLAAIEYNSGNISSSLENYIKAAIQYEKAGLNDKIEEINTEKNDLIKPYKEKLVEIIQNSTSEVLNLDYIAEKLKLTDIIVAEILKELIKEKKITGQVDISRKRYTKMVMIEEPALDDFSDAKVKGTTSSLGATGLKVAALPKGKQGTIGIGLDARKINTEKIKLSAKLGDYESRFEKLKAPFSLFMEYEDYINQMLLLDHKQWIVEHQDKIFSSNGLNKICPICFKTIKSSESLVTCPNSHRFHQTCTSIWVKNQDSCPICDAPLFPHILRTSFLDIEGSTGDDAENLEIIANMQTQISKLKEELEHLKKVNATLKETKGDTKDYVDTVIRERELKEKLEKELKRKDLTIRELKSMITLFKS